MSPRPCSARAVSALPYSANRRYCIALHIPRTTGTANNISMPRSGRRLGRATFYYLKQIAAHSTRLNVGCYAQWRICFCGAHGTILSLAQNRGFCRRGVPATFFRERALLHYPARCADNRNVILSRRACGVSKNLLRFSQSSCNAIMPAFLPLSFRLSERQRTHGEISHIVRLFLQCTLHAYIFQAFISYPGDFSTAHGRQAAAAVFRAPLEMTF